MHRKEKIISILLELGLPLEFLETIEEMNDSFNLPYHNQEHMYTVALRCYEIAKSINIDPYISVVAALFHDFDHSGGHLSDAENIENAIEGLHYVIDTMDDKGHTIDIPDEVENCIRITEFPYVNEPTTIHQEIIRDADLLQLLDDDMDIFMKGLSEEMGIEVTAESTLDFLKIQTIYTEKGYELMELLLAKLEK